MDEKEKSGQQPSENKSFKDPELTSLADHTKNSIDDEEEIIELTEDMVIVLEDEIIELTDVVEVAGAARPAEKEQDIIILEEDISDEYIKDDFAASLGMEIESELDSEAEFRKEIGKLAVSPQQVEAAIERVVQRILEDKIDSILIEVIERAVTQEINRLKNVLRVNESDFD